MKVGEVAKRAGVGVQTLHYYERLGLLPQPERSAANYRLYGPEAVRRVRFIKKAQRLGFSLEEIKSILDLREGGRSPCRRVAEIAQRHLQQLDARIAALEAFRQELAALVAQWAGQTARARKCAGEFCDLIERVRESLPSEKEPRKNPLTL
nr:heavy metal-responsive transcriptional regulator [Limisphaera ngatamarikiensis]